MEDQQITKNIENQEEKTFEDICYEFQKKIVDIFNEEEYIPFLLKYYLVKDIWENIEEHKNNIHIEVTARHLPKHENITVDINTLQQQKDDRNQKDSSNNN